MKSEGEVVVVGHVILPAMGQFLTLQVPVNGGDRLATDLTGQFYVGPLVSMNISQGLNHHRGMGRQLQNKVSGHDTIVSLSSEDGAISGQAAHW